jgi:Ser/Thr protein kinase RdoA (MazF antagonist)
VSDDLGALAAWDVGEVRSVSMPGTGTINRTLLVETASGSYVLRGYRHADRAPVTREHAAIAHARARGIPAVAPLPLPSSGTILDRGGRFYALFPPADGTHVVRAALTPAHIATMGGFLAQLHAALADVPLETAARRDLAVDPAATLARIDRLEAVVRARPSIGEQDRWSLVQLAGRRDWIARASPQCMPDLAPLGRQVIHGDYQETNLFFQSERVSAIIDWDQTYVASRAWEVVRTIDVSFGFAPGPSRIFFAGYCAQAPLDAAALDLAASAYALMRAHDLWIYEAIYLAGDDRPRRFVGAAPFVPLAERWGALKPHLLP